jgi:hypothetical protein
MQGGAQVPNRVVREKSSRTASTLLHGSGDTPWRERPRNAAPKRRVPLWRSAACYCFSAPPDFESPCAPAPGARSTAPRPEVPAEPVAPGSRAGLAAAGAPDGAPLARSFPDCSVAEPRRSGPAVAGLRSACAGRAALGVVSASALPRWARPCSLSPEAEGLDDRAAADSGVTVLSDAALLDGLPAPDLSEDAAIGEGFAPLSLAAAESGFAPSSVLEADVEGALSEGFAALSRFALPAIGLVPAEVEGLSPPVADEVPPSGACDAALPLLSAEDSLAEGAGPAGLAPVRPPEADGGVSLLLAADEGWLPGAVALVEGCDGELEVAVEDDPGWLAAVPLVSGRAPERAGVDELVPAEFVPAPEPLVGPVPVAVLAPVVLVLVPVVVVRVSVDIAWTDVGTGARSGRGRLRDRI